MFKQDVSGHGRGIANHRAILSKTIRKSKRVEEGAEAYAGLRQGAAVINAAAKFRGESACTKR